MPIAQTRTGCSATLPYALLADGSILLTWGSGAPAAWGSWPLGRTRRTPVSRPLGPAFADIDALDASASRVVARVSFTTEATAVVEISLPGGELRVIKRSREQAVDSGYLSAPTAIEFPTTGGLIAHALFYAPRNPDFGPPADERPPLIVMRHGGPTSSASPGLDYETQYLDEPGIRRRRRRLRRKHRLRARRTGERLHGKWGIVDVDDCVNAARYLARAGSRRERLVIRGGSAGGYTTLAALTFRDEFAAGASHFGVADAGALAVTPTSSSRAISMGSSDPGPRCGRSTRNARRSSTPTACARR